MSTPADVVKSLASLTSLAEDIGPVMVFLVALHALLIVGVIAYMCASESKGNRKKKHAVFRRRVDEKID